MTDVSPDLSQYVSLVIYDADPSTLVAQAQANALAQLPGYTPVEGDTAMVVWEGMALMVAQLIYAVNRIPGATVQTLAQLFGITPNPGTLPTATATLNLNDTSGLTIPIGSQFSLALASGPLVFQTTEGVVATPSSSTVVVPIQGQVATSLANGLPAGTSLTVLTPLFFVDTAVLATEVGNGANSESTQSWLSRMVTTVQGLSSTLVTAGQFQNFALNNGAFRANAVDNYDATVPGVAEGVISVAVIQQGGSFLSSEAMAVMAENMNAASVANLAVRVVEPAVTVVNVTASVQAVPGSVGSEVQAAVTAALQTYLSTDTWNWGAVVRYNKLLNVIETVPGVDYVSALTVPSTDTNLTGFGPLASAGTIAISVGVESS